MPTVITRSRHDDQSRRLGEVGEMRRQIDDLGGSLRASPSSGLGSFCRLTKLHRRRAARNSVLSGDRTVVIVRSRIAGPDQADPQPVIARLKLHRLVEGLQRLFVSSLAGQRRPENSER